MPTTRQDGRRPSVSKDVDVRRSPGDRCSDYTAKRLIAKDPYGFTPRAPH